MTQPDAATPPEPSVPAARPASLPLAAVAVAALLAVGALGLAWFNSERLRDLEQELVRRQAGSQATAAEAQKSAQANAEQIRELGAKLALAEARLAEVALQRAQLEDLLQSFSRSRDENIVSDLEAGLRLATQQTQLTGSAEPLMNALRQADERLQRLKLARLEGVRRALLRDMDRLKAVNHVDTSTLVLRLDEVTRLIDELPLLSEPQRREQAPKPKVATAAKPASAASAPVDALGRWWAGAQQLGAEVWDEAKGLLRVTRIDQPNAMLLAPEQAYFLRENLKLRLLNARLALMSRQHEAARADLQAAVETIERYADAKQRRTQLALELLRPLQAQARPVQWPRPEDSLAALAAATGVVR